MGNVIDLTLPLKPGMRGVEITQKFSVAQEGWNASTISLYSHAGTHMDAQVHFDAGQETIDQHTLQRCMGRAWLMNLSGIASKSLIKISSIGDIVGKLSPGDMLVLRTDWSRYLESPAIYREGLPRISEELALWCVERKVKLLGVEPPSVADVTNLEEVTRIHKILMGGGVTIVEGLCNLDKLIGPKIFFAALPLNIAGGDGCPCRAFAIEGDESVEQLTKILA